MSRVLDFWYALPCRLGIHDWYVTSPLRKRCHKCQVTRKRGR